MERQENEVVQVAVVQLTKLQITKIEQFAQ